MLLQRIEISKHLNSPAHWQANLQFNQAVLLVGRNATGKSKILAAVGNLGRMITGKSIPIDCTYYALFEHNQESVEYNLSIQNGIVVSESFSQTGTLMLQRNQDGNGWATAVQAGVKQLQFRVPLRELAVVAKRDLIQHPFLEPLHQWARALRYYRFNDLRRHQYAILNSTENSIPDPTDSNQAVALFHAGAKAQGPLFSEAIVADLNTMGYNVADLTIEPMDATQEPSTTTPYGALNPLQNPTSRLYGLSIQETDLSTRTRQPDMSDGLFRALSLLIHAVYAEFTSKPSCMLIDDIGEGLDYERSTALIQLLMAKAEHRAIQLVMSTNDRFVMNAVPLKSWCGLKRTPSGVQTICELTHPEVFDDFKLTGLNNFDFFTMDFFDAPRDSEPENG